MILRTEKMEEILNFTILQPHKKVIGTWLHKVNLSE